MTLLAINWADIGVQAAQFVFSFSIIVVLHELGHYFPAKWFKCRIEKFYLFFNPWFSIFKKKIGDTEWGLGWIPFGGYVKISGMIDESMDKEQMKLPPEPWEFRSKPAWQRLIIMVGGVIVNLFLGFFIYAMMLWHWGEEYLPVNNLTYGIVADSLGKSIGLKDGDKIVTLDGKHVEKLAPQNQVALNIILKDAKVFQIERDGKPVEVAIPSDFAGKLIKFRDINFITPRMPTIVDSVAAGSAADKSGLRKGDKLLSINEQPVPFFNDFKKTIQQNKGKEVALAYLRGTDTMHAKLMVSKEGTLGFFNISEDKVLETKKISYTFFESLPAAIRVSKETLQNYWLQLKLIFSGKVKASESVGSVFSIAKMYSTTWDWQGLWRMTAFFSLVLALMNILPIPALDGGHALFTLIEMITGRKPSDKFIERAQMVGMVLLLGLMAYALGLDIFRMFK
jgi:regulator of sigma E protease